MKRIIHLALAAPILLALFSAVAVAQSESRDDVLKQIETKRAELSVLEKKFLAPSAEDRAAYAEFLRQPDTGLIRLLPREVYGNNDYKNNKSLTLRGGGAYYSFERHTHEYGYGSDIELGSGYLSVGFAGADYGMLTTLGDLPIEEISIEHSGVQFMATYNVPSEEPKARLEYRRFAAGTTVDDRRYQTRLPVAVGTTYLLRSINYDTSDVLVALRVIRRDADGSVIIAWRLLKKYPKPELARNLSGQ
jgi:hypothetical protein